MSTSMSFEDYVDRCINSTTIDMVTEDIVIVTNAIETVTEAITVIVTTSMTWEDCVELVCLVLIGVFGITGNLLLAIVLLKSPGIKSTDYLVATLAFVDLCISAVSVPLNMTLLVARVEVLSPGFCKFIAFISYTVGLCSATVIAAIAIDRYILSCKSRFQFYNSNLTKAICVIMPIFAGLVNLPYLLYMTHKPGSWICLYEVGFVNVLDNVRKVSIALILLTFFTVLVCYARIVFMLRKRIDKKMKKCLSILNNEQTAQDIPSVVETTFYNNIESTISDISVITTPSNGLPNFAVYLPEERDNSNKTNGVEERTVDGPNTKDATKAEKAELENKPTTDKYDTKSKSTGSTQFKRYLSKELSKTVQIEAAVTNRTTTMLFLISMIFMCSWSIGIIIIATRFKLSRIAQLIYLLQKANVITNPILFVCLSSKFRKKVRKLFCKR